MLRALLLLIGLGLLLVPAAAVSQSSKTERVIIYDASGSMQGDAGQGLTKAQVAADRFVKYLQRLEVESDTKQTEVMIFGRNFDWAAYRRRNPGTSPQDYRGEAGCGDIREFVPAQPPGPGLTAAVSSELRKLIRGRASDRSKGGMTPMGRAMAQAINKLDPVDPELDEIVVFTDYEAPNCLDGLATECDVIANELRKYGKVIDAYSNIKVILYDLGSLNAGNRFGKCFRGGLVVKPVTHPPTPEEPVTLLAKFARPVEGALEPDPDNLVVRVVRLGTGVLEYSGAPGAITLSPNNFQATIEHQSSIATERFGVPRNGPVVLTLDPARAVFEFETSQGPIRQPVDATIQLQSPRSTTVLDRQMADGESLDLAGGTYTITAKVGFAEATETFVARLGDVTTVRLTFDKDQISGNAASTSREVIFDVVQHAPTLLSGEFVETEVTLIQRGRSVDSFRAGRSSRQLEIGPYTVQLGQLRRNRMPLQIEQGSGPVNVSIQVVPGRFVARSARDGAFHLADRSGRLIASFKGDRVEHSLPDGDYTLTFRENGATRSVAKDFAIELGQVKILRY